MLAFKGTQRNVITTARDALQHFLIWDNALPALPPKSKLAHTLIVPPSGLAPTPRHTAEALVRLFNHHLQLKAKKVLTIVVEP